MRIGLLVLAIVAAFTRSAEAQILTTEVWLGKVDMRQGTFDVSDMQNISNHPGYDNQPAFFPDGASLLFTTEEQSLGDSGLGVHAVRYWFDGGRTVPLSKARGFSPTPTPDGASFTTLREGTVWLHDIDGTPLRTLLPQVKTAGYYTRIDEARWVLFMNEADRQIAIWDETRSALTKVVPSAITAPYRVPGTQAVTFVVDEGATKKLMRLDLTDDRGSTSKVLAIIPFRTGGAHAWTSRGTLLMASGNAIHEWNPERPDEWPIVYRFTDPALQGITRIALSPGEDRIALVSTPDDASVLRESRDAANRAFAAAVAQHRDVSWSRAPASFELSGDRATEHGTSVRRWRAGGRVHELTGTYDATWRRTIADNGTPAWTVASERYETTH